MARWVSGGCFQRQIIPQAAPLDHPAGCPELAPSFGHSLGQSAAWSALTGRIKSGVVST